MIQEPQKRWPKVSSCCRAPLGIRNTILASWYFCTAENCGKDCDAVNDEGLEKEQKCECHCHGGIHLDVTCPGLCARPYECQHCKKEDPKCSCVIFDSCPYHGHVKC